MDALGKSDTAEETQWYVYLLECEGGSYYAGITTNVERRVAQHLGKVAGGARYTRSHRVKRLAAVWCACDRTDASRLEWRIKHMTHEEKAALAATGNAHGHERVADEVVSAWWTGALG